jgi:hypothetical protein
VYAADSDDDWVYDSPEEVVDDPHDGIGYMVFLLEHAGRDHHFAFTIDMVLMQVERLALGKSTSQLTATDRDQVLKALALAAQAGYDQPPVGLTREQTMHGLWLMAHTVAYWRLSDEERQAQRRVGAALKQGLRVFRNKLHNTCLLEDIAQMAGPPGGEPLPSVIAELSVRPETLHLPVEALRGFASAFSKTA